jgi:AraC-like DNA-binding protein
MTVSTARPWVRSGVILGIVDFLERNGFEPREIVGDGPMKMVESADSYRQVDLLHIMSIFQQVADHTNRPDIGLELGQSVDLAQLGPIGFMFMNAPTVGEALVDFVRFGPVFQTQAHFGLKRGKRRACVEYSSNHPEMPGWEIDSEVTVGYIMGIIIKLMGRKIVPDEIHFDHPPICKSSDYLKLLSVRPSFGRKMNRLYYPLNLLDEPIRGANPLLYAVLSYHMSDLANAMPKESGLIDVISNNIRRGLGSSTATLEHVASELGIEPRTLQRRLLKTGTSFQKLFDQIRLELALYYLDRTTLDVTQIAFELGYAEASVFSRAFKRWTGMAPGSYRKKTRSVNEAD